MYISFLSLVNISEETLITDILYKLRYLVHEFATLYFQKKDKPTCNAAVKEDEIIPQQS